MREGFRQLLLTMTGFENAHRSSCSLSLPDKLIPGPCPHPDLDHQLESFFPHLVLALLLKVTAGTGHGGTEGRKALVQGVALPRAGMGLGGSAVLGWGCWSVAHSTYPARARVAEGTVNTITTLGVWTEESTVSPCWKGRKNYPIKGWLRLKMEI